MFAYPRQDLVAGVVVFLVALPLCLGIAQACGVPPISGLVAGIIGGLVVPFISRSPLSVTGPAAGLTSVVLAETVNLGGLDALLAAVIGAGVLQCVLGIIRAGRYTSVVPSAVIKGMLAAIGITIILKQLPSLVGWHGGTVSTGPAIVGIGALAILFLWERTPLVRYPLISPALVVVVLGTIAAIILQQTASLQLSATHFVSMPVGTAGDIVRALPRPRLSALAASDTWRVAVTIAVVASLETLLSLQAVDRLDPGRRKSPPDRELLAQGVANVASGFLGGLPVTAVIARSGANVAAGGRERLSSLFHGVLLFIAVIAGASLLNRIPLAVLAAVLIRIGFRFCPPALFRDQFLLGTNQFLPFVFTLVAILATDLMEGVMLGIVVGMVFVVRQNVTGAIVQARTDEGVHSFRFRRDGTFLSKPSLLAALDTIEDGERVLIDAEGEYLDFDVKEALALFAIDARHRHITLELRGIDLSTVTPGAPH